MGGGWRRDEVEFCRIAELASSWRRFLLREISCVVLPVHKQSPRQAKQRKKPPKILKSFPWCWPHCTHAYCISRKEGAPSPIHSRIPLLCYELLWPASKICVSSNARHDIWILTLPPPPLQGHRLASKQNHKTKVSDRHMTLPLACLLTFEGRKNWLYICVLYICILYICILYICIFCIFVYFVYLYILYLYIVYCIFVYCIFVYCLFVYLYIVYFYILYLYIVYFVYLYILYLYIVYLYILYICLLYILYIVYVCIVYLYIVYLYIVYLYSVLPDFQNSFAFSEGRFIILNFQIFELFYFLFHDSKFYFSQLHTLISY
jgi:hypothetical protein